MHTFSRRQSLRLLGGLSMVSIPSLSFGQGVEDRKFIFVILRGAMDGLSALMPDDAEIDGLRGSILPALNTRLDLSNGFRLHPSFTRLRKMYSHGDAAFIHASATPYRQRSHFEAQDALETLGHAGAKDGWLNRALLARGGTGLAVGHAIPLALRGAAPSTNWSPPLFERASDDLLSRLSDLYADDNAFAAPLAAARENQDMAMQTSKRDARRFSREYTVALSAIGKLMSAEAGPGIGMVALDGWDTHANQKNELTRKFAALDAGLTALQISLGPNWKNTCIVVCSEFGRTVAANGSKGTDHGTGGLTMLLGGAVKGGMVHGDWPGVASSALYEGRDLRPVNDIPAILKGVLRDHLGIDRQTLDNKIFPNTGQAFKGLIKA